MKSLPVFTARPSIPILSRTALIVSLTIASAIAGLSCSKSKGGLPADASPEVREQIERLSSQDAGERADAARKLGEMGERAAPAVPFLIEMLDDEPTHLGVLIKYLKARFTGSYEDFGLELVFPPAAYARLALSDIGKPAVEPLISAVQHRSSTIRSRAARALGNTEDARAIEPLIAALKDRRSAVRSGAALGLWESRLKDGRTFEPQLAALKDKYPEVRTCAAGALGALGDRRAVEPLIAAMNDESEYVRARAAVALGELSDSRALDPLIAALNDQHEHVRGFAATGLGDLGDARAVEPLLAAMNDEDDDVRSRSANALKRITKKDFAEDKVKWREWWEENEEEAPEKLAGQVHVVE